MEKENARMFFGINMFFYKCAGNPQPLSAFCFQDGVIAGQPILKYV